MNGPFEVVLAAQAPGGEYAYALALGYLKAYADALPALKGRVSISLREYRMQDPAAAAAALVQGCPHLVGFSCYIWNHAYVRQVLQRIRVIAPGVRIVLGGPEASRRAEEILSCGVADFVVRGEGEQTFAELLERLVRGSDPASVAGLAYLREGRPILNPPRPLISDLAAVPCPYEGGILRPHPDYTGAVVIETSRGCPFDCAFCDWVGKGRVRYFPVERVLASVAKLLKTSPGITFFVADSDIFLHQARAKRLLRGLRGIGKGTPAQWRFNVHLGRLDKSLARLADWGQFVFAAGVQSTNPAALLLSNRSSDVDRLARNIRTFRSLAPKARLTIQLIYGLPGDTLAGYRASLDWLLALSPTDYDLFRLQILPGSAFATDAAVHGIEYDGEPPYLVRATRTFPARDIEAAGSLSFKVTFLMSHPAIRRALELVRKETPGSGSFLDACDEIDRRLESRGTFSLSVAYAKWLGRQDGYPNPVVARWPCEATEEEQLEILATVREWTRSVSTEAVLGSALAALFDRAMEDVSWQQSIRQPGFQRLLLGLVSGLGPGKKALVVCREDFLPAVDVLEGDVSVVLLRAGQLDLAQPVSRRVIAQGLVGDAGASSLISVLADLRNGYDSLILAHSDICLMPDGRRGLLGALAPKAKPSGELLIVERPSSCAHDGVARLQRDLEASGWRSSREPSLLRGGVLLLCRAGADGRAA